jgi:hypothetical protein
MRPKMQLGEEQRPESNRGAQQCPQIGAGLKLVTHTFGNSGEIVFEMVAERIAADI